MSSKGARPKSARARLKAAEPAKVSRPSRQQAEAAVRTLIQWAGDDPDREGLR
ncbi:MAG: GTP cyclohydrolase I FolE, partial [Xanthobacteraceae bacterium]